MNRIYFTISLLLLAGASMSAQNIDPTVEVSRDYEGKLVEVHKPSIDMAVPDTMHVFDLEFDYSVFENPYKGAYEFNPYVLEMKPSSSLNEAGKFYLNAGAGYTLHPLFDLLWSPLVKGPFKVDVYGTHRSYIGKYRALSQLPQWNGYDLFSKAGADLGYDWKKAALGFGAFYEGVADKDYRRSRSLNAVNAYVSLKSKSSWPENFLYDLRASYRFAEENMSRLGEHDLRLDAVLGPNFGRKGKVLIDAGVDLVSYAGALESTVGSFRLTPHYVLAKGRLRLDVGVCVSAVASSGISGLTKGQVVYPDVRVDLDVLPEAMRLYLNVGGGEKFNTYSSLVASNHHLDLGYGLNGLSSVMGLTVERVSAVLGLEGRITSFFSYDLKGGYSNFKSALLDCVIYDDGGRVSPAVGYAPFSKWFASFDWALDLDNIRFDGALEYTHAFALPSENLIGPSALTGDVSLMYNWKKRVYAGVDCEFASYRASRAGFRVPGYADLGISAEYVMNRKLSFWLRGGNLLDMEIQRNLMFAEKGINFTAGICLKL